MFVSEGNCFSVSILVFKKAGKLSKFTEDVVLNAATE